MDALIPDPKRLIQHVKAQAQGDDPRALLAAAVAVSNDLEDLSETVLDHFVEGARRTGVSWSQIGTELGVTKQAVQQRFPDVARMTGPDCAEIERLMTPKAKRAVRTAHREARRLGSEYVGSQHLLLAILRARRGLATRILDDVELAREQLIPLLETKQTRRSLSAPGSGRLAHNAAQSLLAALDEARALGHNYIGTEHLLLGLVRTPGKSSELLKKHGVDYTTTRRAATALLSA